MGPWTLIFERLLQLYSHFNPKKWVWLVSYSGGKDSTLLLLNVLKIAEEKEFRIHVVYNDCGGDLPELRNLVFDVLNILSKKGHYVYITKPRHTFFDYLLMKYSPPRWNFRWCCKRLKELPFRNLLRELMKEAPILNLLGTRKEEARWRNWLIKRINERLVYVAPLNDYSSSDIWHSLKMIDINELSFLPRKLEKIYNGAKRSGCWFCPLVIHDDLLAKRPWLLKLKYEILEAWCTGKRERIVELSKLYPNLIQITIDPVQVQANMNKKFPCGRRCDTCQVRRIRIIIKNELQSLTE